MNGRVAPGAVNMQPNIEHTRRELLNFMLQQRRSESVPLGRGQPRSGPKDEAQPGFNWSSLVEAGLSSWWHDHPARAGALLIRSATEEYARKKPLQVVTIAAIAGAAIVLFKPWRLLSTSTLMLSLFRSSNFTGMATSVLETAAQSLQRNEHEK